MFVFVFVLAAEKNCAATTHEEQEPDTEQLQLEACFICSNQFGINQEKIVNPELYRVILEWLGTPYVYSGESMEGTDCSGFVCSMVKTVYHHEIEGSSKDLWSDVKPVAKKNLREGDLVFFKIQKRKISHVGIYLGNNKFAHASVKLGVVISDLDDPYYAGHFYKGGRLKQ